MRGHQVLQPQVSMPREQRAFHPQGTTPLSTTVLVEPLLQPSPPYKHWHPLFVLLSTLSIAIVMSPMVIAGHQLSLHGPAASMSTSIAFQRRMPWPQTQASRGHCFHACKMTFTKAAGRPFEAGELSEFVNASSGVQMPRQILSASFRGRDMNEDIMNAATAGFRGFDTAAGRGAGEQQLGDALETLFALAKVPRERIFIQTKVNLEMIAKWFPGQSLRNQMIISLEGSLKYLQVDYVDSLVLHAPDPEHNITMEAWSTMEEAFESNCVKQLGIANINNLSQLQRIYADAKVKPAVILMHFGSSVAGDIDEAGIRDWCLEKGISIQQSGRVNMHKQLVRSAEMTHLAEKYNVDSSALFTRYLMGLGIIAVTGKANTGDADSAINAWQPWRIPLTTQDAKVIEDLLAKEIVPARKRGNWKPSKKQAVYATEVREPGKVMDGKVVVVNPYGVFVSMPGFGGKSALLPISEISSGRIENIEEMFKVGDEIKAMVQVDATRGKAILSTKALETVPEEMLSDPQAVYAKAEATAALRKAASSSSDGKDNPIANSAQAMVNRIDPADGKEYSFAQLSAYYGKDWRWSEADIKKYWNKCKPAKARTAARDG